MSLTKMKSGQRSSRFSVTNQNMSRRGDGAGSKLTYVGVLVVFDDLPEFKVTRHDRYLQTQVRGTWKSLMDPHFSSYVVIFSCSATELLIDLCCSSTAT